MILLNIAFEYWTPEDIEAGECSDSGMSDVNVPHTFKDLVHILKQVSKDQCSVYPLTESRITGNVWATIEDDTDWQDGCRRVRTLHFSRANDARSLRYWKLAFKAAGLFVA